MSKPTLSSDNDREHPRDRTGATAADDRDTDASRSGGGTSLDDGIAEIEQWVGISSTELTPSPDTRADFDQVSRHGVPAESRGVAAREAEHALGNSATALARPTAQRSGDAADAASSRRGNRVAPERPAHETQQNPHAASTTGNAAHSSDGSIDTPVPGNGRPGFIDNDDGSNIRNRPAELDGSKTLTDTPLPPATRVFASGHHPQSADWWYVTAFLPDAIVRGYVQGLRVTTDLPEPTARLYQVKSGDTAETLAAHEFASAVRDGHDLRYYENVLLFVNQAHNRAGVRGAYQAPGLLGGGNNNVQLEAGRRIWLVSPTYARAVEGAVPSGSLTGGAVAKVKRFAGHVEDLIQSVTESPDHLGEVAGEYAQAIRDHMAEIIGIMAGFVMAEAASAFLAATPTGVGQIAAVAIQLGLAAFGAAGVVEAGIQAIQHAQQWLTLAWSAGGDAEKIASASVEFVKLLVTLAMAALSYLGIKGNVGKAAALARSMPSQLPAFAVVGGRAAEAGAGTAVATSLPSPSGPLGTAMAMSTKDVEENHGSSKDQTPTKTSAADTAKAPVEQPVQVPPTLKAGKNFKEHFVSKKALIERTLDIKLPKLKEGGDQALLNAISDRIADGTFTYVGRGTLKKGMDPMNIYRGHGLTVVTTMDSEWVTVLQAGEGLDVAIRMMP